MTFFDHPIFRFMLPYASLDEGRLNLDFHQVPEQLQMLALDVQVNCVACAAPIHPLRARVKSERSRVGNSPTESRLYYSPTCPTDTNPGCTRTHEAKQHKVAYVATLMKLGVKISG